MAKRSREDAERRYEKWIARHGKHFAATLFLTFLWAPMASGTIAGAGRAAMMHTPPGPQVIPTLVAVSLLTIATLFAWVVSIRRFCTGVGGTVALKICGAVTLGLGFAVMGAVVKWAILFALHLPYPLADLGTSGYAVAAALLDSMSGIAHGGLLGVSAQILGFYLDRNRKQPIP